MRFLYTIILLVLSLSLYSCWEVKTPESSQQVKTLAQVQSEWIEKKESQSQQKSFSDSARALVDISNIFSEEAFKYEEYVWKILIQYLSDATPKQRDIVMDILSNNTILSEIQTQIQKRLWIKILENDIQWLLSRKEAFLELRDLTEERLNIFKWKEQTKKIEISQSLISTILNEGFSQNLKWTQKEKKSFTEEVLSFFYTKQYVSNVEELEKIVQKIEMLHKLEISTENITQKVAEIDENNFIHFLQKLSQSYKISLKYNTVLESYKELIISHISIENTITEINFIESNTPLINYKKILEERQTQIESIINEINTITYLSQEEVQSFFQKELSYKDIELIYKERILVASPLEDIQSRILQQEYIDDSQLVLELDPIAYVKDISWNVIITNVAGGKKMAEINMLLYADYKIETLPNSSAEIIFSDESFLRLEEDTKLTLMQQSEKNYGVDVKQWNIWARVIKPLFSGESFSVETDEISLAVRWTSIYLDQDVDTKAYIVDSYTWDGAPSLTAYNKSSQELVDITAGHVFHYKSSDASSQKISQKKSDLMLQGNIANYVRDDIRYLSLLESDMKRGFYNNPISGKNSSKNLLDKISGEIEATLPKNTQEKKLLFKNPEIQAKQVSKDNVYVRIIQDELISDIKSSNTPNKQNKINAISNIDIDSFQESQKNLRGIERKIDADIVESIIESTISSSDDIEETFTNFDLSLQERAMRDITETKEYLQASLTASGAFITQNMILPSSYKNTHIKWRSSQPSYIAHNGKIVQYSLDKDINFSLTAYITTQNYTQDLILPFVFKKHSLTDAEKLNNSIKQLKNYIDRISVFETHIPLPDFNASGNIIPEITWIDSSGIVESNGDINRPEFYETNIINHKIIWKFTFGTEQLRKNITIPKINKKDPLFTSSKFSSCDTNNIILENGQVWAMCNAWSNISGVWSKSYGDRYIMKGWAARLACESQWYHLPSKADWNKAKTYFKNIDNMARWLKLPKAWGIHKKWGLGWSTTITNKKRYWSSTEWYDDEYWTLTDTTIQEEPRKSRFSVRCIKKKTAIDLKQTLKGIADNFWPDYIQDAIEVGDINANKHFLKDNISLPISDTSMVNIQYSLVSWANLLKAGTSNNDWVKKPHCNTDKSVKVRATFTLSGTTPISRDQAFTVPAKYAYGEIIWNECYELIAEAHYNNSNDYKLKKPNWTLINNSVKSKYGLQFQNGGVKVPRGWDAHLAYNLSSLNLGNDWAIEMSVKGADFDRANTHRLLWFKSKLDDNDLFIYQNNKGADLRIVKVSPSGNNFFKTNINEDSYVKIVTLIKNNLLKLEVNWERRWNAFPWEPNNLSFNNFDNKIYIWSSSTTNEKQWDGNIKNIKIYKKGE